MRVVANHQPNFLPWLGFFEKLDRADTFVMLDEVQLPRRSATTRVGVLLDGQRHLVSLPIRHVGDQSVRICDALIDVDNPLLRKGIATLERAYSRCPYWSSLGEAVVEALRACPERLVDLNLQLIALLADALGVDRKKVRLQSELGGGTGQKSELMASLVQAAGGDVYLSGGQDPALVAEQDRSAADYNDPAVYEAYGVSLRYQNFAHPEYDQQAEFVSGLSALDALLRLGPETLPLMRTANADSRLDGGSRS
jgi:hypothetical protein